MSESARHVPRVHEVMPTVAAQKGETWHESLLLLIKRGA